MENLKNILNFVFIKLKKERKILFFVVFLVILYFSLAIFSKKFLVEVPKNTGTLYEVVIGEKPQFINPVLGYKKIDLTLIKLIYKPLFEYENGELKPILAKSYTLSDDGKKYKIQLKKNQKFEDGVEITVDDILYTLDEIKNPENASYLRPIWLNVKVNKIDKYTFELILPKKDYYFKRFLEFYPLPKHIWEKSDNFVLSQFNLNPIASGDFKINEVIYNNISVNGKNEKKIDKIILAPNEIKIKFKNFYFKFYDNINEYLKSDLSVDRDINWENLYFREKQDELLRLNFKEYKIKQPIEINFVIKNNNENSFLNDIDLRKYIFQVVKAENNKEIEKIKENFLKKQKKYSVGKESGFLEKDKKVVVFSTIVGLNSDQFFRNLAEENKKKLKLAGIQVKNIYLDDKKYLDVLKSKKFESIIVGFKAGEEYWLPYYFSNLKDIPSGNISGLNSKDIDNILIKLKSGNLKKAEREKLKNEFLKKIKEKYLVLKLSDLNSYYYLSKDIENLGLENIVGGENRFKNIQNWVLEKERVLKIFAK